MSQRAAFSLGFGKRIQSAVRAVEQFAPAPNLRRNVNRRASVGQFRCAQIIATADSGSSGSVGDGCGSVSVVKIQLGTATYRERLGFQRLDFTPTPGFIFYAAETLDQSNQVGDIVETVWWNHRYWIVGTVSGGCDSISDSISESIPSESIPPSESWSGSTLPSESGSDSIWSSVPRVPSACCPEGLPETIQLTVTLERLEAYAGGTLYGTVTYGESVTIPLIYSAGQWIGGLGTFALGEFARLVNQNYVLRCSSFPNSPGPGSHYELEFVAMKYAEAATPRFMQGGLQWVGDYVQISAAAGLRIPSWTCDPFSGAALFIEGNQGHLVNGVNQQAPAIIWKGEPIVNTGEHWRSYITYEVTE